MWAEALEAHKDEAIEVQSEEVYERYMKYLTGCADGSGWATSTSTSSPWKSKLASQAPCMGPGRTMSLTGDRCVVLHQDGKPDVREVSSHNEDRRRASTRSSAHYDVSNEFFQLFMDPTRTYSCAYFPT